MTEQSSTDHFDAIIVGMGPGGEVVAGALLAAKKNVAVIERELIGGECAYWACIPSKVLLRAPEAVVGVQRVAGADHARLNWPAMREYRDDMIRHLDDSAQEDSYRDQGATVIRGEARLVGPHTVTVSGRTLTADEIIIATGSQAVLPPIDGLDAVPVWTNRETTTLAHIPARVVVIGGSAVGTELGLFLHSFGAEVTILQRSARLLSREDPRVGELLGNYFNDAGPTVKLHTVATRVRRAGDETVVELDDGSELRCEVIVAGTGRQPRTADLGIEDAGGKLGEHGEILVDDQCRAGDGLWAVGDVTGIMPFTHVATYQGRIAAANLLGDERTARYDGIPRVVFTNPEIAAVGLTQEQANKRGITSSVAEVDLTEVLARPWTYEQEPRGHLAVLADRDRGVLIGAWAVGPQASEWIHTAALAIREEISIARLLDQVAQFPTYNEGWLKAVQHLDGVRAQD